MGLHIEDLALFKKILSIDGQLVIQALNIDSFIYHDIIGNGKYVILLLKHYIIT
ncbi:hypothetical protein RMAECT_1372 [Rickettsia rhipicephali str. Ect]|uniref:Uncharacterized protein n=1 Tax=Rickettsia rhipicephali str. Ect TaxID=1359199 RepID=A0A0F3PHA4_RICRH|nr:hypothetical protein RMAECT_1372 [Rickettsia rhipicephali str. Ect]